MWIPSVAGISNLVWIDFHSAHNCHCDSFYLLAFYWQVLLVVVSKYSWPDHRFLVLYWSMYISIINLHCRCIFIDTKLEIKWVDILRYPSDILFTQGTFYWDDLLFSETQKTVNTENKSGMFVVLYPITSKVFNHRNHRKQITFIALVVQSPIALVNLNISS